MRPAELWRLSLWLLCLTACRRGSSNMRDEHNARVPSTAPTDSALGVVRRVGADPTSRLLLVARIDTIPAVALVGAGADSSATQVELAAAEGLEIRVVGSRTNDRLMDAGPRGALVFRVHAFAVRAADGMEAHDGILKRDRDAWFLEQADVRRPIVSLPAALTRYEGARVFLVGPLSRPPQSFGVLRAAP